MTADLGDYTEAELMERGAERILYKPFRLADVALVLRQLIAGSRIKAAEQGRGVCCR